MDIRIDIITDEGDDPMLMELELIEPDLFLRFSESGLKRMADGIWSRLERLADESS